MCGWVGGLVGFRASRRLCLGSDLNLVFQVKLSNEGISRPSLEREHGSAKLNWECGWVG